MVYFILTIFFIFITGLVIFYQNKFLIEYKNIISAQENIINEENKILINALNLIIKHSIKPEIQDYELANECKKTIQKLNDLLL